MNMRLRFTLAFVLVVLVAILSVVLLVRLDTGVQVRDYMMRGGMIGADGLVTRLESYYRSRGSWQGVESLFGPGGMMMGAGRGGRGMMFDRIQIVAPSGRVLYDTDVNGAELPGLDPVSLNRGFLLDDARGKTVGYLLVNGGANTPATDVTPLIQRLNIAALRAALIAGILGLLLALLLSGRLLKPVQQLTGAAQRLSAGNLDVRVPVHGHDELADLATTFNRMTESLQQSEERRRSMTADIAHELRTPLAVQRAQLEALQDGIYPLSAQNLQPVLDQNETLTRLVEDLRTLALADAGELSLERTWVNLLELVKRVLSRFQASAAERDVALLLESPQTAASCLEVWGDPLRLEQILNNLLSNAIRYSPAKKPVDISVVCQSDLVEITVHDHGPGIDPGILPHIFERFYRADPARSREEGGTGLGLSIARQLTLAQDGTLTASNHPQGGSVFTLRMPVAAQDQPTDIE